jgi:carbamate kinase
MGKVAVIALGGNSLIKDKDHQSVEDQYMAAYESCTHIAELIEAGYDVVITHGNGPQVGFILLRSELSHGKIHEVPLDSCGADTQGALGYNFQQSLGNIFARKGVKKPVVTVVTQVVVDKNDPKFKNPSKPIGEFYTREEDEERKAKRGWDIMEDAGRGWRRVVASPLPVEIIEEEAVKTLLAKGFVVVSVGGGGIPVIKLDDGTLKGVAAVIDKDYASGLLASNIQADYFIISTAVEKVYLNYGKPEQKGLDRVTLSELKKYKEEGHFKPGSMLPKVEAVISFIEKGGKKAIITCPAKIREAVEGKTGTHVIGG